MNKTEDAEAPDGVKLYDFEDFDTHRKMMFDDAKNTLVGQYPKVHNGVRMELKDVDYIDPEEYDLSEQKKALHQDKYLTRRLRGTIVLSDDNTDEVLDEKRMTLMRVPYLTERGTWIREGNEWGSISQQRLLPGAYSRYQANGELETVYNVRPGTGSTMKVTMVPETAQYKFVVNGASLSMYSLLKDLGVPDEELKVRWGDEVFAQNAKYDVRTLDKAYAKIVPEWMRGKNPDASREEKAKAIKEALNKAQVATNVINTTLPNLSNMRKQAEWRTVGPIMQKMASVNITDLQSIATYINEVAGKAINIDQSKEKLMQDIKNVVTTGSTDLIPGGGTYDESDTGAALVRQMLQQKVLQKIRKKLDL